MFALSESCLQHFKLQTGDISTSTVYYILWNDYIVVVLLPAFSLYPYLAIFFWNWISVWAMDSKVYRIHEHESITNHLYIAHSQHLKMLHKLLNYKPGTISIMKYITLKYTFLVPRTCDKISWKPLYINYLTVKTPYKLRTRSIGSVRYSTQAVCLWDIIWCQHHPKMLKRFSAISKSHFHV